MLSLQVLGGLAQFLSLPGIAIGAVMCLFSTTRNAGKTVFFPSAIAFAVACALAVAIVQEGIGL